MKNKIDEFHLNDIKNEIHPSVFFTHDDYNLLIIRLPSLSNDNNVFFESLAFIITDEEYYFYDKSEDEFIDLKDFIGFYKFLNKYVDKTLKLISFYSDEIETIEDHIYEGESIEHFNKQWFIFKTKLIRVNRVLNKAIDTINLLMRKYRNKEDYLEINFEDIYEHLQRSQRNSDYLLEKLDSIYNFNLNQTNEQMNRIVYILTLLSGIFLPLNLIVGFFGMNTTSLPFTKEDGGTLSVIFVLIISMLLATLITIFMKKR